VSGFVYLTTQPKTLALVFSDYLYKRKNGIAPEDLSTKFYYTIGTGVKKK